MKAYRTAPLVVDILFELGCGSCLSLTVARRVCSSAVRLLSAARTCAMPLASATQQPGQEITKQRARCAHENTSSALRWDVGMLLRIPSGALKRQSASEMIGMPATAGLSGQLNEGMPAGQRAHVVRARQAWRGRATTHRSSTDGCWQPFAPPQQHTEPPDWDARSGGRDSRRNRCPLSAPRCRCRPGVARWATKSQELIMLAAGSRDSRCISYAACYALPALDVSKAIKYRPPMV